jgi:integrase
MQKVRQRGKASSSVRHCPGLPASACCTSPLAHASGYQVRVSHRGSPQCNVSGALYSSTLHSPTSPAGLPRDLVLYLARHECGTKICREKGIEYARRLLGHTNISTTQRYMHLDDRELADAQDLV